MRLGELLVKDGLVSAAALEEALESQVVHGGRLGTNLVELGLLSEQDLAKALGKLHNCAYASGEMVPDPKAVALVHPNEADDKEFLPMRADATRLSVAVVNPHDFPTLDAIAFKTGKRVVPVVIPEFRMNQLLRRHAKAFRQLRAIDMEAVRPRPAKGAAVELAKAAERPPDLMSEEEFQSVYAQALRGGSDAEAEADVLEGEIIITGEEVMEAPVAAPPQGRPAVPAQPRPGAPRVDIPAHVAPSVPAPGVPAQAARAASTQGQPGAQGVPAHLAVQPGAQGVPAHVAAQMDAQGVPAQSATHGVPAHLAGQAGAQRAPAHLAGQAGMPAHVAGQAGAQRAPAHLAGQAGMPAHVAGQSGAQGVPAHLAAQAGAQGLAAQAGAQGVPAHLAAQAGAQGGPAHLAAQAGAQGVPAHVAAQVGAQGTPAHVAAQVGAQGVPAQARGGAGVPAHVAGQASAGVPAHVAAQAGAAGAVPPGAVATPVAAKPAAPPPTPLTFPEAQAELGRSSDREDVARTVLRFAMGKWRRCLLLSVQGNLVTGWHGMGQGVSDEGVRRIGVPLRDQSTFRLVRDLRSHYVGPVKRDAAMGMFYRLIGGGFPSTAVILPLLVRGKVVHLLYVDNGAEQFTPPDVGELLILSQGVGRSYEAMMRRRKSA
ncbi:general secretion pathway protein GspE [Corallococcus macrosporus]|uniref:General secretion pathway protein GspE n=1 Tax=Corallococcus macrosporus TaxID=35 RepID=A0ABS3DN67_9BACT|nr:general secretion pathway protein GspE [Corallococcus macrosporus]MBN8232759.1 general secretion pathway protein GspE [Corallococcus macrosporus]